MQKISWKTVKLDKEGLLHLAYKDIEDKQSAKVVKDFEQPAHPDLIKGMEKLIPHFAILCEQVNTPVQLSDLDGQIEAFHVRGFHRGSNEEIPGVTIVGNKILKSGKVLGLNAPFLRFRENPSEEGAYPFQEHLEGILAEVEIEAELYVKGKYRPDPQGNLFTEDNGDKSKTTVEVLDPEKGSVYEAEKPKRGRKKAVA